MDDYFGNHDGDSMFDYNHDGSLDFNESCAQNQYYQDMLEAERQGVIESSESHISYDNNDHHSAGKSVKTPRPVHQKKIPASFSDKFIVGFTYFCVSLGIMMFLYLFLSVLSGL